MKLSMTGLSKAKLRPGYHDEPLKGQRSIRLSKAYRAIYSMSQDGNLEVVCLLEGKQT